MNFIKKVTLSFIGRNRLITNENMLDSITRKRINDCGDILVGKLPNLKSQTKQATSTLFYKLIDYMYKEAIVNAIVHRDYTSNGSVQVMLFKDRLEIWNPGQLPPNLTPSKLLASHGSFPANPLLAEPMYLAGYIERLGTGTLDMFHLCSENGLSGPDFIQDDVFKTIIGRNVEIAGQATGETSGEATGEVALVKEAIRRVVMVTNGELKRSEIQETLQLKHDDFFRIHYMLSALSAGFIEMTYPDNPTHSKQKYRLTAKGESYKKQLTAHNTDQATDQAIGHDTILNTAHVTAHITAHVKKLIQIISGEMSRPDLQDKLRLKHRTNFRENYLAPALKLKLIEMTIPEKPQSKNQKFRLTQKGKILRKQIEND